MAQPERVHVLQDGRDFYLERRGVLRGVVTYPSPVQDFNMEEARGARAWFLSWCKRHDVEPLFEGEGE